MPILVSGSLAYDRIMNFDGRFADHILPEKIHVLNVCFNVNGLTENLGGTAGNIAYGLAQLGESPIILGNLGRDGARYLDWLEQNGVQTRCIQTVEREFTAGAFITTDLADNQITGFNPGAMNIPCAFDPQDWDPAQTIAIVAPGNLDDMTILPRHYRQLGLPFILDPGQSLNIWKGDQLAEAFQGAHILISNDYELEMIMRMTGLDLAGLLERVENLITTQGEKGSVLRVRSGQETHIPAAPASEVKDPTGAGDAYRAGLIKGLVSGLDLALACHWGAALASFAVACHGTQEYQVDQNEFKARLDSMARAA